MYVYKKPLKTLFLVLLYTFNYSLQAFNAGNNNQKQITVRDYTILNNKNVNHTLDDIEDLEDDLTESIFGIHTKLLNTNNQPTPLILGAVLQHQQNQEYHQYLIASTGLLSQNTQSNAVKRAHKKRFHLIQATPEHVILQLLAWLQLSGHYTVIALHTNKPVCQHCHLIANNLWKQKLQTNEKGCLSMPFPLLDKMPNLTQQYINSRLNLSLVKNLVVPIMGYISKEEMQKTIQQKNKKINNYRAYLLKDIAAKINRLRNEFNISLDQIDIQNENSVKSFVQKATVATKEGHKQLNEDIKILLKWYNEYKGRDWKWGHKKDPQGNYWGELHIKIEKKMKKSLRNTEKGTLFSSISQSLKTLLPTNQARLCGINEFLEQNRLENENHRLEVARLNAKLEQICLHVVQAFGWRWIA